MPLSRVSTPILPSRYDEVLNQRVAEHARALLAAAKPSSAPLLRLPRWAVPALVIAAGVMATGALLGTDSERQPTKVPFAKTNVISTGAVGRQTSAEDLIGPSPSAQPQASAEPAAELLPSMTAQHDRASSAKTGGARSRSFGGEPTKREPPLDALTPAQTKADCPNCKTAASPAIGKESLEPATEVLEEEGASYSADLPALPKPPDTAVTVGTRIRAKLTHAVVTSFAGAPVTALVQEDVIAGGQVVVPAGTLLAGEAFGTNLDDRAQVTFSALVTDGHTLHFRGLGIGADNRLGLVGRVVRRASAPKKGVGRVLGSVGAALAGGLAAEVNGGVLGNAGLNLAGGLATELTQLDRTWATERSDKAIEVPAGAEITVYVQTDVRVQ
jgi:hypothetical protein